MTSALEKLTGLAAIQQQAEASMRAVLADPLNQNLVAAFDAAAERLQIASSQSELRKRLVKQWGSK